jgi:hypothetical protein
VSSLRQRPRLVHISRSKRGLNRITGVGVGFGVAIGFGIAAAFRFPISTATSMPIPIPTPIDSQAKAAAREPSRNPAGSRGLTLENLMQNGIYF